MVGLVAGVINERQQTAISCDQFGHTFSGPLIGIHEASTQVIPVVQKSQAKSMIGRRILKSCHPDQLGGAQPIIRYRQELAARASPLRLHPPLKHGSCEIGRRLSLRTGFAL